MLWIFLSHRSKPLRAVSQNELYFIRVKNSITTPALACIYWFSSHCSVTTCALFSFLSFFHLCLWLYSLYVTNKYPVGRWLNSRYIGKQKISKHAVLVIKSQIGQMLIALGVSRAFKNETDDLERDGVITWTDSQMVFLYLKIFTYCVYGFWEGKWPVSVFNALLLRSYSGCR